jgi:hypothetical protein
MGFVQHLEFKILENTVFRKLAVFPSSGKGKADNYSFVSLKKNLRLALSKRPNRVVVCLPLPEDGNTSYFRNAVS